MNVTHRHTPWGRIIGLLTACLVTLIGVASGLEPEVILLRAAVASSLFGIAAHLIIGGLIVLMRVK